MDNLLAGSIASFSVLVTHPLDTMKTNKQISTEQFQHQKKSIYTVIKTQYRGIGYALLNGMITNGLLFGTFSMIQTNFGTNSFNTGLLTGIPLGMISNPFELLKIQRQNTSKLIRITDFSRKEFCRGMEFTLLREIIGSSIYFGSYEVLKTQMSERNINTSISTFVAGGSAGLLSWVFSYPIDVVKTRVQSNFKKSYIEAIKEKNLWSGFRYCAIRSIIGNGITFTLYENILNITK